MTEPGQGGELYGTFDEQLDMLETSIAERRPVLAALIREHGADSLGAYAETFAYSEAEPIDSREDVIRVAGAYAERTLGAPLAKKLQERLRRSPALLTANHHGPDYFALTVGGSILFSLGETRDSVMPVFAFGDIPLNNLTHPRGILISSEAKLNIFPDKYKTALVSATPSFTTEMIVDAEKRLVAMHKDGKVSDTQYHAVSELLDTTYKDPYILALDSYSDQAVIVNRAIWKRLFHSNCRNEVPEIAFLEMEHIVRELVAIDLDNKKSLLSSLLFEDHTRTALINALNKKASCWDVERLHLLSRPDTNGDERRALMQNAGTQFFWGVDEKGRRVPLSLQFEGGIPQLSGFDDSGNRIAIPYDQSNIVLALQQRRLLPSLFTSFAVVAFARAFKCYGGWMQADYLTGMRRGIEATLIQNGDDERAKKIARIPTENFSTGFQFVVRKNLDGSIAPASAIDIIAHGGLTQEQLNQMRGSISVREALVLGLPGMYPVVFRQEERDQNLVKITSDDIYRSKHPPVVELNV